MYAFINCVQVSMMLTSCYVLHRIVSAKQERSEHHGVRVQSFEPYAVKAARTVPAGETLVRAYSQITGLC